MESRQPKERVYEEFDPTFEWEGDSAADTLKLFLPGFRKEQMKVQVTTTRFLRVTGERELGDNKGLKFCKEIPIPSNYDTNQISAKFERGILFIKHPKITTPDQQPPSKAPQPPKDAPTPPKPPQPKTQTPPLPPKIESPKPELPKIESETAKTRIDSKNEVPDKVKDEVNDVVANKKQEIMAGDLDNVGKGEKLTAGIGNGVEKLNYRRVLCGVVNELKNPKKLMESVITVLLIVYFWLRAMIMKPIRYFKKSEN